MNADQVTYYAERAREYEHIYLRPDRLEEIAQIKSYLMNEFQGRDVFEVACGTGYWTQAISKSARSILATDINEKVVDLAMEKEYGQANVSFEIANVFELEPREKLYNACFGGCIWSHIPIQDFPFFLNGLLSVIEPGGKVILMDNLYVEGVSTPIASEDIFENTYQVRTLSDGTEWVVMKNFPSELEIHSMLSDVADNVEVKKYKTYWVVCFNKKG